MKKKDKISGAAFLLILLSCSQIFAHIKFENPQINNDNKVLYCVEHNIKGTFPYKTLFMADVTKKNSTKILTCFPEKMELLSKGAVLQIRNRYGLARYSLADSTLTWTKKEESIPSSAKAMLPQAVSPDGNWACYVKKTALSKGNLYLQNLSTLEEFLLNKDCDFDYDEVPAKWSLDSSIFVYEKNGSIYFGDPRAVNQKIQIDEKYRKIGEGSINCVFWASGKYLVYINRDLVYKISAKELYTRGLYSSMVGAGIVIGRLPLPFNPHKDRFWVNQLINQVVVISSNSLISSYEIKGDATSCLKSIYSKPFKDFDSSPLYYNVFFTSNGSNIIWVDLISLRDGKRNSIVYRLDSDLTEITRIENAGKPLLSPDGNKVVFSAGTNAFVYDIENWLQLGCLSGEKVYSYVWSDASLLYVGGEASVRKWSMENKSFPNKGDLLFLSSVKTAFWKPNSENIVCAQSSINDSTFYDYDSFRNVWLACSEDSKNDSSLIQKSETEVYASQNSRFRVYTGLADNKFFENTLFVRNFAGKGSSYALYPETIQTSGNPKKVALIFDALDNADGLSHILSVLSAYNIKATFFLNGEFIRRYPQECRLIYESGHDCASMFFSPADLTAKGFIIDEEFIRRGLARNEDEFFAATGHELSLLWHAPFYKADKSIKEAGKLSGYRYIEAGRLALDSCTLEKSSTENQWYLSARDLVDLYVESNENQLIIPISVGISAGTRKDFLYEKLSLLIGSLYDCGYDFTLVRTLNK